ncbi:uncharacterized protein LOC6551602 [Drosophila erecta]|uniref:Uncharacterized protein n=1 Tax=Drosophila erecta TaxID=7220 RepID=B3NUD9_DROER|nr:uncharacterized protein LOC6551602 [Drosophila erecta]EDV46054.2 uncharacterized protein Dere_GG18415 [Drosophila erecta]
MAYTIKLDWIRRILNPCGTRQTRLMHDDGKTQICSQSPWRRLMRLTRNNSSSTSGGNEPRRLDTNKPKPSNKQISYSERQTPFGNNTYKNANLVRMHPLVRDEDKRTTKHKRRLPTEKSATMRLHNAQRRAEQLARTLRSKDPSGSPSPNSTIPLKILEMTQRTHTISSQLVIDAMRTRNMERMVRKSEARMLNERVKKLFEKQKEAKAEGKERQPEGDFTVPESKIMVPEQRQLEVKAVVQLLKKAITLVHFSHEEQANVKDVRISRMQTKLDIDGLHPCCSSIDSLAISGKPQSSQAYHMRIRCPKIPVPRKSEVENKSNSRAIAASLIKEEQRRLDRLRAEKVQLVCSKNNTNFGFINRNAGYHRHRQAKSTDSDDSSKPTDLDMNSLIIDPKSFLTKVLDKKEIVSLDQVNNFALDTMENPDVFSKPLTKKPEPKSKKAPAKLLPQ